MDKKVFMQMIHVIISSSSFSDFYKGNINNGTNPPLCPFPALLTPSPDKAFINGEVTGCINEENIVAMLPS